MPAAALRALYVMQMAIIDYKIYGTLVHKDSSAAFRDIMKRCFRGVGFQQCEMVGNPPGMYEDFHWKSAVPSGNDLCLSCCDNTRQTRDFEETMNLECETAEQADLTTDLFEHEFRIARRRSLDDSGFITCYIRRPPEVQRVRLHPHGKPLDGSFRLKFGDISEDVVSQYIHWSAVAMQWEEYSLYDDTGCGSGESVQSKLEPVLKGLQKLDGFFPSYYPLRISRDGPDAVGAYTWSITFPDETFGVPALQAIGNFTDPDITVIAEPVVPTKLHGYHLTIELQENSEGGEHWRSVEWCSVNVTEGHGNPIKFLESFTMQRSLTPEEGGSKTSSADCGRSIRFPMCWALLVLCSVLFHLSF